MKKLVTIALCAFLFSITVQAQSEVKKDAKKVEHKTAELSSKGYHKVKDKVYSDKVGPGGETIYINKHSQYYYIDSKGHEVFVKKTQLKNK